jgi:D-beta-D-heptose 7-phosphate kinase/D-beta-D-heptose 1-phosphate adenosyltransferase
MKTASLLARSLIDLLEHACRRHIWVIGDAFVDDYIEGSIQRVSPEAPVQVVNVENQFQRLGGAANVANGLAALGAKVTLGSLAGDDEPGKILEKLCSDKGIDTGCIIPVSDRPTTRKLRVMSRRQQMIRLDWEKVMPMDFASENRLFDTLEKSGRPDAIILSDYAKGILTGNVIRAMIKKGRGLGIPVMVDPKGNDFKRYRGATVITPNLTEFEAAVGTPIDPDDKEAMAESAKTLCEKCSLDALLITLGERGMALWTRENGLIIVPTRAREVYDVTGAGDTVVAATGLCLASKIDFETSAMIANAAAGIVVGKAGTSTVAPGELVESLSPPIENKVLDRDLLAEHLRWWRMRQKRIVFTNGCFDLLHVGHLHILNQAAAQGDVLIVGLNTDSSISRLKGPGRPLITEHERASLLAAFDCVDAVVLFDEDTPVNLIRTIKPDVLVKGSDYRIDQVVGREVVEAAGGKVVLVDFLPNKSSTLLMERIKGAPGDGR